ncbi:MAG TPA: hypothetical protein VGB73_04540 [Pyrinomonadaceae bacterium]|jgi:hypothetical protein
MAESNLSKKTTNEHPEKLHGTTVPDVHSNHGGAHKAELPHDEHSHRKEEDFPKESETAMKTKTAPTFTALALAVMCIFSFMPDAQAKAFEAKSSDFAFANFADDAFKTDTFQDSKSKAADFKAFDVKGCDFSTDKFVKVSINFDDLGTFKFKEEVKTGWDSKGFDFKSKAFSKKFQKGQFKA